MRKTEEFDKIKNQLLEQLDSKGRYVTVSGQKFIEITNINFDMHTDSLMNKDYDVSEFIVEFDTIVTEMSRVVMQLEADKFTRQAVINNWQFKELPPCICLLQFLYRSNALQLIIYIRSSDINRLENDLISLTRILEQVCLNLHMTVGKLYIHIGSLHLYA